MRPAAGRRLWWKLPGKNRRVGSGKDRASKTCECCAEPRKSREAWSIGIVMIAGAARMRVRKLSTGVVIALSRPDPRAAALAGP